MTYAKHRFAAFPLLLIAPTLVAASDWMSTRWVVSCEPELRQELPELSCDDRAVTGVAAVTRDGLEDASEWLESLGFMAPRVETLSGKYRARVSEQENESSLGVYFPDRNQFFVNSTYFFAVGGAETEEEAERWLGVSNAKMGTMVHELFHAVQHSYKQGPVYSSSEYDWIWEGTADAVESAWLRRTQPQLDYLARARHWDDPLHRPAGRMGPYATSRFWRWTGDAIGSTDGVAYLDEVFRHDLERMSGVAGVDAALRRYRAGGLYDIYPEFVARALRREHRNVQFSSVPERAVTVSEDRPDGTLDWPERSIRPLAANVHSVRVEAPPGKLVGAVVELESDHPGDLHLIVDGALARRSGKPNEQQTSVYAANGEAELDIRVANVAPDAVDSRERDYRLKIEVSLVDPCSESVMDSTVHREVVMGAPRQMGIDSFLGVTDAGSGTMSLAGIVSDGGIGCTYPISALNTEGAEALGLISPEEADAAERAKDDATMAQLDRMLEISEGEMDRQDHEDMQAAVRDLQRARSGTLDDGEAENPSVRDVVIEVFSPNMWIWQAMSPGDPMRTRHDGLGGWRPNATAHLLIQLTGVGADDLEEGGTYPAAAFSPPPGDSGDGSVLPTPDGFYLRWSGNFRRVPYPPPRSPQDAQIQEQNKRLCRNVVGQMAQDRGELDNARAGLWDCEYEDVAWEGQSEVVTGSLSGTVTIDRITPTVITGSFELSGSGTKHQTDYSYYFGRDGELRGDREDDRTIGPQSLQVTGTFRAPNGRAGLYRRQHESILIE